MVGAALDSWLMIDPKHKPSIYMKWLKMVREALAETNRQGRNSKLRTARSFLKSAGRRSEFRG
jgi:hypothetical protein